MIPFFDTQYTVRRSRDAVFELFSDFPRYLTELPEFHGARLTAEPGPITEGKVYWLDAPGDDYEFRTRVEVVDIESPQRFAYDYQYTARDSHEPLSSKNAPMPWNRARVILTFEDSDEGRATRVRAQMQVYGVNGFFQRWKVSTLKTACARTQRNANANMVRIAENLIPSAS